MEKFFAWVTARFRDYRYVKLEKTGRWLLKLKLTPNRLTFLSLISGLLAVSFLFQDYLYFVVFGLLHLILDSLDGVVAKLSQPTVFGDYFDHGSDSLVAFLILLKVGQFLGDIYPYIVAGLYALGAVVHFVSRTKAPMIFIRTAAVISLLVFSCPYFPYPETLITIGYLVAGAATVYSLARQLQWLMKKAERF